MAYSKTEPQEFYNFAVQFALGGIARDEEEAHDFAGFVVQQHLERDEEGNGYEVWDGLNLRQCWDAYLRKLYAA